MHRDPKPSTVIACVDAEDGVRGIIGRMPGVVDAVVVVDNNGTDRTAELAGRAAGAGDAVIGVGDEGTYPTEEIERLVDVRVAKDPDFSREIEREAIRRGATFGGAKRNTRRDRRPDRTHIAPRRIGAM